MIIAQISDTHIALGATDADRRASDLERTLADINALDPAPDVIIHTGDVVHGGRREDYAAAASLLATARAPVYVAPGNRDDRENLRHSLSRWVPAADSGFLDYAVEDFPVRLVAVDTTTPASNKGDFSPERARGLTALIEAETTQDRLRSSCIIRRSRSRWGRIRSTSSQRRRWRVCRGPSSVPARVVAVFCGHVHRSTWGRIGNIPVMVAPCTATTLRKGDFPQQMHGRPVYHLHRLNSACELATEVRIVPAAAYKGGGP